jgi:hypothetical protein
VQTVVHIKDGLWGNLATIVFSLSLAVFAVWLDHRSHGEVSIFVWGFAGIFVLFCYIPIDAIRRPKSRLLAIDGDYLVWQTRSKESGRVNEERLPLKSIRALEFITPRNAECQNSGNPAHARLLFVTAQRSKRELPSDFWPGIYRKRIIAAVRERVPDVEVVERLDDPD